MKDDDKKAAFLREWLSDREKGRTSLLWLCNEVLGYKDVTDTDTQGENHGPLLAGLHKFQGRVEVADPVTMRMVSSRPRVAMWAQPSPKRNRLFLFPRDHLKTTVITIAHSIQWILNYEDVRILLSVATGAQQNTLMNAVLGHFRSNAKFRFLYPEFCPPAQGARDFGSIERFTVPNRTRFITEPTMMCVTIGKVIAGTHQDVHKHSDLVDKENVKTVNQIKDVNDHFGYTDPLLARYGGVQGWRDVEGTRYDFGDLYGTILDSEEKLTEEEKSYIVVMRSAEVDAKTKQTLWPARYTWESLQQIRRNPAVGPYIYQAQYNQRCIPASGGLATREQLDRLWIPRSVVAGLVRDKKYRGIHVTVDLAGMDEKSQGDRECITVCGFMPTGQIHVIDIRHGHFSPFEVINHFFDIELRYKPGAYKMEKGHHAQVLEPFLRQEMEKRRIFMNVLNIPRDSTESKQNRISGLQPFLLTGRMRIVDDLECDADLIMEVTRFPKYRHDDILDTLADQLHNANAGGIEPDLHPEPKEPETRPWWHMGANTFSGFDVHGQPMFGPSLDSHGEQYYHKGTGL